tara:strand:+ start:162 stop:617 length:456 start_codon:yes stop_codon:yes gene_type:complete
MRVYKEMENIGMEREEITVFSLIGFGLWTVLLWIFSERYVELNEDNSLPDKYLKNITITILSFHIITLIFTLFESYYLNSNIWISWITIGLAISATFLNATSISVIITDKNEYENVNVNRSISSLVLQCMANALMLSYIFRLIRSKRKIMY